MIVICETLDGSPVNPLGQSTYDFGAVKTLFNLIVRKA